jgi:small GTP-binding protein
MAEKTVKIVVAGDGGVGKTSFLNRLVHDNFDMKSELTKGIDFFSKNIQINGTDINFVMWDFAGQDQFKSLLDGFVDGSIAAFLLFDLTRASTIENVVNWLERLKKLSNMPIMILGTKYDLLENKFESNLDQYLISLVKSNNLLRYMKISSKTGYNIKEVFHSLINMLTNLKV